MICSGDMRFRRAFAITIAIMIMASASTFFSSESGGAPRGECPPFCNATPHQPIRIDSNADFDAAHGVTGGNGSISNPWIMTGLDIDGAGLGCCIYVGNATHYFAISECHLANATGGDGTVFSPDAAIAIYNVTGCALSRNTIAGDCEAAIAVESSRQVAMADNTMAGCGLTISGDELSEWNSHEILSSNSVNGLPVRYLKNQSGGSVPRWAGEVVLANCTGVWVDGLRPCSGTVGVLMGFSSGNTVTNNTVRGNGAAGLRMFHSDGNEISDNLFELNGIGLETDGSFNNSILHNNFVENPVQARESASSNLWDGGYMCPEQVAGENITKTEYNDIAETAWTGLGLSQDALWPVDWDNYSAQMDLIASANFTRVIDASNLQTLDVRATGWSDVVDLDIGLFLDGSAGNPLDGIAQWSECVDRNFTTVGSYHYKWGYDLTAMSNDEDADESLRLFHPMDGRYLLKILGSNVTSGIGHFNLTVGLGRTVGAALGHGVVVPGSETVTVREGGMSFAYWNDSSDNNAEYVMTGAETSPWSFHLAHGNISSKIILSVRGDGGTQSNVADDYWVCFDDAGLEEGVYYSVDRDAGIVTIYDAGYLTESIFANYTYGDGRTMGAGEYQLDCLTGEIAITASLPPFLNEMWVDYTYEELIGGNYWSDGTLADAYYGPNQSATGADGIADAQYRISGATIDNYPLVAPRYLGVNRAIRINGNADFDSAHGVVRGSGTAGDPWVIDGLNIDGAGLGACLYIGNTTGHAVVRNSQFRNAGGNQGIYNRNSGVLLFNAQNVTIENSTLSGNECGAYLAESRWNKVVGNSVAGNECGIRLESSTANVIDGNVVTGNVEKGFEDIPEQSLGGFPPFGFQKHNMTYGYMEIADSLVVDKAVISGVPAYHWYCGCSPTANGIVLGYWDVAGYSRIVAGSARTQSPGVYDMIASPGNYYDYCMPIDDYPTLLPDKSELPFGDEHTNDCIADFSNISQSRSQLYFGWGNANIISNETNQYLNYIAPEYRVRPRYLAWGDVTWENFKAEIDRGRPVAVSVNSGGYESTDHLSVATGYGVTSDGMRVYSCHNTWDDRYHWYVFGPMIEGRIFGLFSFNYLEVKLSGYGVYLSQSINNTVFHNTICGNTRDAFDDMGNAWDGGYPVGGNYWGAPHVADDLSGPMQNTPGPDGIGDAPHDGISGPGRYFDMVANETLYGPSVGGETGPFSLAGDDLRNITLYLSSPLSWFKMLQGVHFDLNFQSGEITLMSPLLGGRTLHAFYNCSGAFVQTSSDRYPLACPLGQAPPVHAHFYIPVHAGWNLISLPLEPLCGETGYALGDLDGDTIWTRAMWYDAASPGDPWKQYCTAWGGGMNDLRGVTPSVGIWLYVSVPGDGRIAIAGVQRNATSIALRAGWNLVGFPSLRTNLTMAVALWGTGADRVETFDASETYLTKVIRPDYQLKPGEAYWIHVPSDTIWTVYR